MKECDIVFLAVLPSQATEMLKDIRPSSLERVYESRKDKNKSKPLFVSTLAATGYNKLRLMLNEESIFLKTKVNVSTVRDYLAQTQNNAPEKAVHPVQMLGKEHQAETDEISNEDGKDQHAESAAQHSSRMSMQSKKDQDPLKRVLSQKAIKIGTETGITAEFVVQQTGEQLVTKLDDLFMMFDIFQESLYSNDPTVQTSDKNTTQNKLGLASSRNSAASKKSSELNEENSKVMYEESILMTLLGPDYNQFISEETGEWINED